MAVGENLSSEREASDVMREVRENGGKLAEYNVIASYDGMVEAKKALDALEWAGMEPANFSLLGDRAAEAAGRETNEQTQHADKRLALDIGKRALLGLIVGIPLGIAAGIVAWALYRDLGMWSGIVGGAAIFGTIGGFGGAMWSLDANQQAELTYHDTSPGRVLVGVHSDEPQQIDKAADILAKKDPQRVYRFDRGGKLQTSL